MICIGADSILALVAICSILSDPNVNDPLVPEIAGQYLQDCTPYEHNADCIRRNMHYEGGQ